MIKNNSPATEREWDIYLKLALKKSLVPWYKMLYNALMMVPNASIDEVGPKSKPDVDALIFVESCKIPWYKTIFS